MSKACPPSVGGTLRPSVRRGAVRAAGVQSGRVQRSHLQTGAARSPTKVPLLARLQRALVKFRLGNLHLAVRWDDPDLRSTTRHRPVSIVQQRGSRDAIDERQRDVTSSAPTPAPQLRPATERRRRSRTAEARSQLAAVAEVVGAAAAAAIPPLRRPSSASD